MKIMSHEKSESVSGLALTPKGVFEGGGLHWGSAPPGPVKSIVFRSEWKEKYLNPPGQIPENAPVYRFICLVNTPLKNDDVLF